MPVTTQQLSYTQSQVTNPNERCYRNFIRFDGENWELFMPLFLQEAENFVWNDHEKKHQFLRRLTGKATQIAKHIGDLHHMPWQELYELAAKWYGHSQNKFQFQVKFTNQKRESSWTYSQFATFLRTLAVKGYPDRSRVSIDEMVLDRLVAYARETDHIIYERFTQSTVTSVQEFVNVADAWLAAFPGRDPNYDRFWKDRHYKKEHLTTFSNTVVSPCPSRPNVVTRPNFQHVNKESRWSKSRQWTRRPPRSPCPICHDGPPDAGFHWRRECPQLRPERQNPHDENNTQTQRTSMNQESAPLNWKRPSPSTKPETSEGK
jgi:hypothetical protein